MRFLLSIGIIFVVYMAYANSDSCVQCDSSINSRCATNPEQIMAKQCANNTSQCYVRLSNGNTIRGCASELSNATAANCNNNMDCLICSFMEGCNGAVFPQHRLSCLQCSGSINSTCATNLVALPQVCPIYKPSDKCFMRRDNKNRTDSFQRGCLSSALDNGLCKDATNCYTCEGAGCNFLAANNTYVPWARDSALAYGSSLVLVLVAFFVTRQS